MEIRVRRTMTGQDERDSIMQRYGDRAAIERLAADGDHDAGDALWVLRLVDENPARLLEATTIEDVYFLEPADLSRLTTTRLYLIEVLKRLGEASVKELTAVVGRDAKNVSEDVSILEEYGLIESRRVGKEKRLRVAGDEITVLLVGPPAPSHPVRADDAAAAANP